MALDATHIKFALDIKDKYQVNDLSKYLSGTIYPDSRYISGINRELTHGEEFLKSKSNKNNFEKGWLVHLICDHISHKIMFQELPDLLGGKQDTDWWIDLTAVKVVQDIKILEKFDVNNYLPFLNYVESPNNESTHILKKHYRIIREVYKDGLSFEDVERLLLENKIKVEFAQKIINKAKEFLGDNKLTKKIDDIYRKMIAWFFV